MDEDTAKIGSGSASASDGGDPSWTFSEDGAAFFGDFDYDVPPPFDLPADPTERRSPPLISGTALTRSISSSSEEAEAAPEPDERPPESSGSAA